MVLLVALAGCTSERHFARDSLWPFGNPNGPENGSEDAQRALGKSPDVTPIAPQAGNVWPGPVQPVPTIADIEKNMNQPLGGAYMPSLPSPYPPGQEPLQTGEDKADTALPNPVPQINPIAPGATPQSNPAAPAAVPGIATGIPGTVPQLGPANPHARQ
jgi:hypothetical protein